METGASREEPRRLADFLRSHQERILSNWLAEVRRLAPARDLDRPMLLDHLPEFLDDLAEFLDEVRAGQAAAEPVKMPVMHALERLEVGYDLAAVVEEYAILRRCIVELVHQEGAPAMRSAQLARLHSGIDQAIVTSTARYHEASERTLRALDRISSAALTHREPDRMLPELLKVLLETCASVDAASLLLLEGDVLRVRAAAGIGLEETVGETVSVGHSLAGRVAQTRTPASSRDVANDPLVTRESIRRSGLRAYYCAPMLLGDELIGVASIGSRSAAEFSEEDRLLFRTMSDRAAALIAQARLDAQLGRRNEELAAALEYRDRILGVLSHDLHNPLGVILLTADSLGRGEPLSGTQQRMVRRVAFNARRVDNMVRDLLDYTRSRQGQALPISRRKAEMLALCRQVLDGLQVLHPDVELRCTAEGRTDGWLDPERAAQVISNLVSNAIVHGRADAPVTVALRGTDQDVWMEIHNEGPPIPEALLPHIFEAFHRGNAAAKGTPGLGLGLFISQQIVVAHGGSIEVESKEGYGTTLRVRWPKRNSASAGP
jgi:signal transduction histidine kinase